MHDITFLFVCSHYRQIHGTLHTQGSVLVEPTDGPRMQPVTHTMNSVLFLFFLLLACQPVLGTKRGREDGDTDEGAQGDARAGDSGTAQVPDESPSRRHHRGRLRNGLIVRLQPPRHDTFATIL